ncbi:MAG: hypothetical protein EZS28_033374 [Streblomastix strix]|uniref:Uncharacterized protein n=1 Tax=Streblomastix strix TaxID=222440 RepID=A0A5J4UM24_9EUKA|nr:MAG: hypothetical protein EZS28_033374 [Streblomastix strix]
MEEEKRKKKEEQDGSGNRTSDQLKKNKIKENEQKEVIHPVEINSLNEIVLSNGTQIGNRQLVRYYRQKIHPDESRNSYLVNSLIQQYRKQGWLLKDKQRRRKELKRTQKEIGKRDVLEIAASFQQNKIRRKYLRDQLSWK